MLISRSSVVRSNFYLFAFITFKFQRLWQPNIVSNSKQNQQQQEGKTSATLPLLFDLSFPFFSLFLRSICQLSPSLPPPSLSISCPRYLSLSLGCTNGWACTRAMSAARVVRATQTQPLYTRSLSLFLIPLTQSTCPYVTTISLQHARESRKEKSRCERVRWFCTFAATDARCAHARERMHREKARFPLFVNCARQTRLKSKSLRARTAAAADLLQMQRDRRRVQRLPRLLDYSTTRRTHFPYISIARAKLHC